MANELDGARASKYTDGPNECGYWTAGIDMPYVNWRGEQDWHINAIEFHNKDRAVAEGRRDAVIALLTLAGAQDDRQI